MILEVADIQIHPGQQAEFEAALDRGIQATIVEARGFIGYELQHGIESPERYLLLIHWESLENHTVDFRNSPAFAEWRAAVSPYFAAPPKVEHFSSALPAD